MKKKTAKKEVKAKVRIETSRTPEKKGNGNNKMKIDPSLIEKVKKLYPSKFKHSTSIARALGIERKIAQKAMRLIEAK